MADSARLQILKEVERLLKTVSGMRVVTRNSNDVLSLIDYPAAIIQAGTETIDENVNGGIENVDWLIGVELWVKSENNLGDVQEETLAKVQKTLAENPKLLSKVHFFKQNGPEQWIPINDALTITGVMLTYRALFKRTESDPYALL